MFLTSKNTTGTSGLLNEAEVIPTSYHSTPARHFLATASLTAMAVMMSSNAFAADSQSVPSECSPTMPVAGGTVTCSGEITSPISTDVDDLTLVITDGTTLDVPLGQAAVSVSGSGNLTVSAAANSTIAGGQGIEVRHSGAGTTTITSGDTTGVYTGGYSYTGPFSTRSSTFTSGSGISVRNEVGGGAVNITSSGTATGGEQGIAVRSYAASSVTITAEDTYANGSNTYNSYTIPFMGFPSRTVANEYFSGRGIEVDHRGGDGDINITSTGSATGANVGIEVSAFGSSNITISAEDSTGLNDFSSGIEAFLSEDLSESYRLEVVSPATGDIDITSNGTVSGGDDGILARNAGSGSTTITVNNVQTTGERSYFGGEFGFGVAALTRTKEGELAPQTVPIGNAIRAEGGEGDVNVTASGTVTGGENGILVRTSGAGDIDISTQGVVTGQNETGAGIYAAIGGGLFDPFSVYSYNGSSGDIMITSTEAVSGGSGGIVAGNFGTGTTTIEAADVTATSLGGFSQYGYGGFVGDDRRLSAAPINEAVTIETLVPINGGVIGLPSFGIGAIGGDSSGDINVTSTGTVSGGDAGIHIRNYGQGQTNVNAVNVTAPDDNGAAIDVRHGFESGGESGGEFGVFLTAVSQTVSDPTEHDVTVAATGTVTGGRSGIEVSNFGIGATTVTAVDSTGYSVETREYTPFFGGETVTLEESIGNGINVYGGEASGDLTVTSTGTASGGEYGINARNNGTGATTITAVDVNAEGFGEFYSSFSDQVVRFSDGTGIYAYGGENSGDITVTSTGTVSAGNLGISVRNRGVNNTTVEFADVMSALDGGTAINVRVDNRYGAPINSGDVLVNSTGTATGSYTGIRVNAVTTGSITVNAVDVMAVSSYGYGYGINVTNNIFNPDSADFATGDLTVTSTGTVTGGETGINARQRGTGDLIVEAVDAIGLNNFGVGIDVGNSTTSISDMPRAIPSGDIIVTSTGSAEGGRYGIRARNYGTGSINIDAVDVSADGAQSYYGGETTAVLARVSLASGTAVDARSNALDGGDITITTTGEVSGDSRGIFLVNLGDAASTVNISGTVTGGEYGVESQTLNGTTINLSEGGSIAGSNVAIDTFESFVTISAMPGLMPVFATSGPTNGPADTLNIAGTVDGAVLTNDGIDTVNLASTGSLNDFANLGDGNDIFNDNGGAFTSVSGGEDADTFNVNAGGRTFMSSELFASSEQSNVVSSFEIFNLNNGISSFAGNHSGIDVVNVAAGAGLSLADGAFISADITNEGAVDIAGGTVGTAAIDRFEQTETGSISFDRISETEADLLNVAGDVTLGGTLNLNQTDVFTQTVTLIDGGQGITGAFDQVNGLAEGVFITQDIEIDTVNNDVNLVTTVLEDNDEVIMAALSPNQVSLIEDIGNGLRDGTLDDDLDGLVRSLGIISSPEEVAQLVEELSPEFASVGLQSVQSLSADFTTSLVNRATLNQNVGGGATQTASLFPSAGINQDDGPRAWLNAGFISVEQDGSANTVDFETDGYEFAIGISNIDAGPASLGFAAGYSEFDTETSADAFGGAGADDIDTELLLLGAHARFDINESGSGINGHFDVAVSYADGEHDFTQNIAAGGVGAAVTQTGETDFSHIGAVARMTFGGLNGETWPIKPYVKAGVDNYDQDAFTIGTGATSLDISGIDNTRYSVGYGADYKHALENSTYFRVGASGTHFFGDTEGELISSFSGAADSGFSTVGDDVDSQFVVEGGVGTSFAGWTVEASGFGQFGDLEGYGGNLNFSTKF